MKKNTECSLIITTYKWPDALVKCLQSVLWQSILPNEIIIAEDATDIKTNEILEKLKDKFPIPIKHFSQEDIGKRKTRINNIAITNSSYPYLIFTDHDMILHPCFIYDHLSIAEYGYFLNGSRFLLNEITSQYLLSIENILPSHLKNIKGKNHLNKIRSTFLMNLLAKKYQTNDSNIYKVRGCNMSFWKQNLLDVNGYDERYKGWGREDSDIAVRLFNNGIRKKSLKFGGITYHINHPLSNMTDDEKYMDMMLRAIEEKSTWTIDGLDKHMR